MLLLCNSAANPLNAPQAACVPTVAGCDPPQASYLPLPPARSDPVGPEQMDQLSSARQGYCKRWWPVPPECLQLAHGTRVCIVRVDLAGEMAEVALPTLMQHVPGFEKDLLVYNSG